MLIRSIEQTRGSDDEVDNGDFISRRLILAADGMGYSVHDTEIPPNETLHMHYKHHFETVLITAGEGEIEDKAAGVTHALTPGVLYALDAHDDHVLHAFAAGLRMTCVFYPALVGPETHDAQGSYPLLDADGKVREK